jgi:hypothetical protein
MIATTNVTAAVDDDALLPVAEAFERVTGKRPSAASWNRWRLRGLRGIHLPTTLYLGKRMCSIRTARDFLEQSTRASGDQVDPVESRTNRQRDASINSAERELEQAGA